ncbi:MAG: acetylornithine/succinylornithine family transaminase [Clostridia bacterium]|nr:acetylornithine/succinylornithine family transaminase [Clostridia bacterium]
MSLKEKDKKYIANTYARFDVEIVSGKGSVVYDADGKRYIDMGSGIGVTCFGIADDEWVNAVTAQLNKVQHMSNLYYTQPCVELAEMLCNASGMKKVFFCNSGAEANECAIKAARKYAFEKKGSDCYRIVTLENSFHGRTVTTLAATGQAVFHKDFQPLTDGFLHTPANDLDAMKSIVRENSIAAIMIECIQGEGGVNPLTPEFVNGIAEIAREEDILLIVDEVQTGNGRTGEMYGYMNYGITPDIVTTAKGLGGGLPLGACMLGEKTEFVLGYGDHGSTYGGNPVACAGAVSVISRMNRGFLDAVKAKSELVFKTLEGAEGIESVSGMGLMIGIQTVKPAKDVVAKCKELGVLCLTAKSKVRLLPALNIDEETLVEALNVIKSACAD